MRDRIERSFAAWGHLAYRRAWLVIGVMLAITAGLSSQLPRLTVDTSTEGFLHEDDPTRVTYESFRHQFGRDELILLAIEPPDIFELDFLDTLRRLHEDIEMEVPKLEEVTSLINARETRGDGEALIIGELLEQWPETAADLAELKRRVLANPLYVDTLISRDARMTTIAIKTDAYSSIGSEVDELGGFEDSEAGGGGPAVPRPFITGAENHQIVMAIKKLVDRYQAPDFTIYLTGSPTLTDHLTTAMGTDTARFTTLAVAAIAIFLTLLFHRLTGVVLPLAVVGLSLLCTLAVMALSQTPLTLPTEILPSFLLAVGVGNSVHILVIFFQRRRLGESKEASIAFAFGHSALAILMTSLTTAGGLLSFAAAEMAPIADFGVFGPIGVMMALAFTIVLLPSLIAVFPMREETGAEAPGGHRTQRLLVRVGAFSTRHAGFVLSATAVLLAVALVGAFQIRFSHDPLRWFPEDDFFRVSSDVFNQRLKGAMSVELLIDTGRENGLHDPDILGRMEELARYADSLDVDGVYVGKTISVVDIVKEIHQALNENQPAFHAIPQDRTLLAQELLLFENSGTDDLEEVVDTRFRTGRVTMRVPFVDAVCYPAFMARLDDGLQRIFGGRAEYTITGLIALVGETVDAIMHSMATSYVIAFLVITPLMVLLIGDLRVGLVSMIPNLTPIVITLGVMGWADIPLDAFTLLVGSIAIGLSVDDTIHFMHNFRRYVGQSGDLREAISATLSSTGQAMLYTTLVLASGFFIYVFSTMNNLFYFGVLTGFTIILAFVACILMAPALVVLVVEPEQYAAPSAEPMEAFQ